MGRIDTTYAGQWRKPGDEVLEKEAKDRLADLEAITNLERDAEDRDLTAQANTAIDNRLVASGAAPLDPGPVDSAILGSKASAAEKVSTAKMSPAELQAKAIASELAPLINGNVSPDVDDVIAAMDDDEPDELEPETASDEWFSYYDEVEDRVYAQNAYGQFQQNPDGTYASWGPGTDVYQEALDAGQNNEEEYDYAA